MQDIVVLLGAYFGEIPGMPHRLRQVTDPSGVLDCSQFDDCKGSMEVDIDI